MAGSDVTPIQPGAIDAMARRLEAIEQWQREMMPSVAQSVTEIVAALVLRPGVIVEYGSTTAPVGFLLCDGTQYPQTTYPALYAVIGATFNTGGETVGYFRVPDKRGRAGVGYDPSQAEFDAVGKTGGEKAHALTDAENGIHAHSTPSHTHSFSGSDSHSHGYTYKTLITPGGFASGLYAGYSDTAATTTSATVTISGTTSGSAPTTNASGSGTPHNNLQPYMAVPYIIKF